MNRYIVSVLLGCLSVSLSVYAAGKGNNQMGMGMGMGMSQAPVFEDIDTNQDGLISKEEFEAFQTQRQEQRKEEGRLMKNSAYSEGMFERIDADQDGFVDVDEFTMHRGSMRGAKPQ